MKYEDRDKILQLTGGGLDIFRTYLPDVTGRKNFRSPFYDDKKASCTIYQDHSGVWRYKDFGNGGSGGDAFWFVGELFGYNLSSQFPKILAQIVQDLNLPLDITTQDSLATAPVRPQVSVQSSDLPVSQPTMTDKYSVQSQPFTETDLEFWGKYGVNQATLERYGVSSLASFSSYSRKGKPYQLHYKSTEPMYCYQLGNSVKIYRPNSKVRFLNAGVRSSDYIFGYAQLPSKGEFVLLTGGEKDVLTLASHGFSAFCLNSETAHLPQTLLRGLSDRFDAVGVLYDMDDTGIRQSQQIIENNPTVPNLFRIDLPLSGSKSEKDVSDFFSQGGTATALQDIIMRTIKQQGNSMANLENFIDPKLSGDEIYNLHLTAQRIDTHVSESYIRSRKLTGVQEGYFPNGQISRRKFYKDGLAEGMGYSWHRNGQLKERATYKRGKLDGLCEEWYDNGQLAGRCSYKAGKLDGLYERWHENGQLRKRLPYRAGLIDGLSETWHPNGRQQTRWNYKDDKLDGLCELWDGGGNLLSQTHYKDNKKNGLHLDYDPESGEMYHWILFENDLSVKSGKPEELEQLEAYKDQTSKVVVPSSPVQEQAQAILNARGYNAPKVGQEAEVRPTQQQEYKHKL